MLYLTVSITILDKVRNEYMRGSLESRNIKQKIEEENLS